MHRLLRPYSTEEFLGQYFGRAVLHIPADEAKLAGLSGAGADEPLELLALEVERAVQASVRVHVHRGSGEIPSGSLSHDTFVIQVAGSTEWAISEGESERNATLHPGAVLYAPRGTVRCGKSPNADGVAVVMSIVNPTGMDLLDFITGLLKTDSWFQSEVPRFAGLTEQADYVAELQKHVRKVLEAPGLLRWFAQYQNANAPAGPAMGAAWHPGLPGDWVITLRTRRNVRIRRATADAVYFLIAGQRYDFPEYAVPALQYLLDRAPVSIRDFRAAFENEFDADELTDLLGVLCSNGMIAVMEPAA